MSSECVHLYTNIEHPLFEIFSDKKLQFLRRKDRSDSIRLRSA